MVFGGLKDMGSFMKQAQAMKSEIKTIHEELKSMEIEGTSKKGLVKVIINGDLDVKKILFDSSLKDESLEKLADLTNDAVNDALKSAKNISAKKLAKVTGGFNVPGLT